MWLNSLLLATVKNGGITDNNQEFQKVEMYKNYFVLIYKESSKNLKRKFRVNFLFTTWQVKAVEWLED